MTDRDQTPGRERSAEALTTSAPTPTSQQNPDPVHAARDDEALALIHRRARIFGVMVSLDIIAVFVANIAWGLALPFIVGWCMSWLTAVAWIMFNEARGLR